MNCLERSAKVVQSASEVRLETGERIRGLCRIWGKCGLRSASATGNSLTLREIRSYIKLAGK